MEARIIQLHGQGVLEIDAAAHRLGCLPIGQIEQELPPRRPWPTGRARDRDAHHAGTNRGNPRRPTTPFSRSFTHTAVVPPGLLARATCAVRDGNLLTGPETNGQRAPRQLHRPVNKADHATDQVSHHETKITDRVKLVSTNPRRTRARSAILHRTGLSLFLDQRVPQPHMPEPVDGPRPSQRPACHRVLQERLCPPRQLASQRQPEPREHQPLPPCFCPAPRSRTPRLPPPFPSTEVCWR